MAISPFSPQPNPFHKQIAAPRVLFGGKTDTPVAADKFKAFPPPGSKILIVTDAWEPQINGVITVLKNIETQLKAQGYTVGFVTPQGFTTTSCPFYPDIRLSLAPYMGVKKQIQEFNPDSILIATEGPLGRAARRYCKRRGIPFTTEYATKFPEFLYSYCKVPVSYTYRVLKRFHAAATAVLVNAPSLMKELQERNFKKSNLVQWTHGVDTELFNPSAKDPNFMKDLPRPFFLYVGRVSKEKNLEAFLDLDLPGSKIIVGSGPHLDELKAKYKNATFTGPKHGQELAKHFASSDVFVFPSKNDTFGLVQIEALASGIPVAAYPVPGPLDVLQDSPAGFMNDDLKKAALDALGTSPELCRAHAMKFSWPECAKQLLEFLYQIPKAAEKAAS